MNLLLPLDISLFFAINHLPHTWVLDRIADAFSGVGMGALLWLLLGAMLIIKERKHTKFFLQLFIVIGISYVVSEGILKPLFGRVRPDMSDTIIVGSQAWGKSFPSTHATIAFASAYVIGKVEPSWKLLGIVLAVAVALSRIYLGNHFPSDVLGGALLGVGVGVVSMKFFRPVSHKKKR